MRGHMKTLLTAGLAGAALCAAAATAAQSAEVRVEIDQAKPVRLANSAATLVVGNPLIADAVIHDDGLLFVFGKTYGQTNLIALNEYGETIYSTNIMVTHVNDQSAGSAVSVHRGPVRYTYSCAGRCEDQPTIGDDDTWYQARVSQQQAKVSGGATQAQGGGDN